MRVAVLGSTGYTGLLLLRLLASHPEVKEILPASSSRAGKALLEVDPGLGEQVLTKLNASEGRLLSLEETAREGAEVVFAALPHLESARICEPFFGKAVVIDLSADFRLKDREIFRKAYGAPPPREDLLPGAVYGLCEWYRDALAGADLIANPGCYPTAALLPLLPLASEGIIGGEVIVNAVSGVSGAGRKTRTDFLFCELTENAYPYAPGRSHRHTWEIEAELKQLDRGARVLFNPHLAPLKRGIVATTVVDLKREVKPEDIEAIFRRTYGNAPFIGLRGSSIPRTREVWGSNRCDIGWRREGEKLLLFSVIDNLMKGASGQAVQNMNIRFGFSEEAGLRTEGEL